MKTLTKFVKLLLLVAAGLMLGAVLFALSSCTKTVYLTRTEEVKVKEYVTLKDTVYLPDVGRDEQENAVIQSDTSRLETKYAASEAWFTDGRIRHTLWNKPDAFRFELRWPTFHRDSIIRIREPYPVEVIKEVRKVPSIYKAALWLVVGEIVAGIGIGILKLRKIV